MGQMGMNRPFMNQMGSTNSMNQMPMSSMGMQNPMMNMMSNQMMNMMNNQMQNPIIGQMGVGMNQMNMMNQNMAEDNMQETATHAEGETEYLEDQPGNFTGSINAG